MIASSPINNKLYTNENTEFNLLVPGVATARWLQ